ncbi:MAG: glycine--tRNA ligase [Candidatus Portnoybacteria bacterium RIFCSPLOWO2_12_FULL_39_9]|uniref:Glycine--tRNA ligase n=1 Tax=Candidatus Portnoybacteria bacterium RIFCSPHIGHO2_12_FULL_38_9 TaxID=1801997 RepID=A0A1G2FIZ6_9BACT|nr:MAG: glycine--tRNA ligase [Candidatus Portnoybacteria bacterium RBG_13_40_8]OGZ36607.1 MAG: glycine--tRNA ligase [Candidatus Portnoybacteria bacterium RIFCSPHIGHO2_02_FULL_39_12]OGZ37501.1 MAG: glycine--tRNA ligase [Candidatus Portnoybacteria bacterium RIFCSPHIGHO2_12_FULL_38_9]OGZ38399.1 MAG: glycine--tRNA ligase [Candidatus Portnoybacteria bacterium RIFCSPLOWO2_01_FULL_38_39]OGZ39842.1 MAG: glycine--tRNA ligase [Candidatus Portnoybacteria bacterium RIFCSPLOWO2_12_FULL_39_9]
MSMITLEKIVSFAKRRGFIGPSSEMYGGFESSYDYGFLGAELKNNIKKSWWKSMVQIRENIVGLDSAILMSPKIWQASGHLTAGFADPLVECKKCHHRFRKDHLKENKCPDCGGELTPEKKFNLMLKTFLGPVEDEAAITYLRAETCQGIYMNYEFMKDTMRLKIPFGIAQIGKAFRNEITPRYFIFKTREFEQMEMQYFVSPDDKEKDKWFEFWKKERMNWYLNLGIKKENLRFKEHEKDELAHYAKKAVDIEYKFPWGWGEIEGIHDRGDWDLFNHAKHSGRDLSYFDEAIKKKFIPHIIETSGGVERALLAFLIDAYQEVKGGRTKTTESVKEMEVVLKLHKDLAPIKVAVLPLVKNKKELVKKARQVYDLIKPHFMSQYDEAGAIGRRYRRQDEIGTPLTITIDFDSIKQDDLTIRDRDSMRQERVKIEKLVDYLCSLLK